MRENKADRDDPVKQAKCIIHCFGILTVIERTKNKKKDAKASKKNEKERENRCQLQ